MRRPTLCSLTPWIVLGGLLLAGCGTDPTPEVVSGLEASADPVDEPTDGGEPQATPTPTPSSIPDVTPTLIPSGSPAPDVCTGREQESFIEVLAPAADATVSSPMTLSGCGNTFEATFLWRVELEDGGIAAEGFGTMTCGNGCVGTFDELIVLDGTGPAVLRVFESSAEDGSEINVVEVAITIS